MPHPEGGKGNIFQTSFSFQQAYEFIGTNGVTFKSTEDECMYAKRGKTDKGLKAIVFIGERSRHGNVCEKCWGFRLNCSGAHIGQCSEGLDKKILSLE